MLITWLWKVTVRAIVIRLKWVSTLLHLVPRKLGFMFANIFCHYICTQLTFAKLVPSSNTVPISSCCVFFYSLLPRFYWEIKGVRHIVEQILKLSPLPSFINLQPFPSSPHLSPWTLDLQVDDLMMLFPPNLMPNPTSPYWTNPIPFLGIISGTVSL